MVTFSWLLIENCIFWTFHTISAIPKRSLWWASLASFVLKGIVSSYRAILASSVYEIPILWFNTLDASTFKLVGCLFRTDTSILVITINVGFLTLHAFSCLCNPKIGRITSYADVGWCKVGSFCWTFAFSPIKIVNESFRTCLTFHIYFVPKIRRIASNTNFILSIWPAWRTYTFFS